MKTIAVPVEPTDEMVNAMLHEINARFPHNWTAQSVYRAALAAAPPQSEPTNTAAPQVNAGSPVAGSDPAPAAAPRFEDAIQGRPLSTIVADENNAAPEQEGQSLEASSLKDEGRAESAPAAAPFTIPACAELSVTPAIYAADYTMRHAPSTLPLSAEEINAMKGLLGANTLCDQALRAIEFERDLKIALEDAASDTKRLHDDKMKYFERVITLEQQLAEKDREIADKMRKLARYEAAGRGLPEVRLINANGDDLYPPAHCNEVIALRDFAIAQQVRADENERDAKSWRDFMQQVKAAQASGETSVIEVAIKGQT